MATKLRNQLIFTPDVSLLPKSLTYFHPDGANDQKIEAKAAVRGTVPTASGKCIRALQRPPDVD